MATFSISANDADMGEYMADTAPKALDAFARDAGYTNYAEAVVAQFGDNATAVKIDTQSLYDAVSKATGHEVHPDQHGLGVATVNQVSYASFQELAQLIGKNVWDFKT
jgi:hypothetical protein